MQTGHMVTTNRSNQDTYEDVLKQLLAEIANQRLQKYQGTYHSGTFPQSASNLAHYLALRQFDLRHLQDRLAHAGLSSLGRAEASILSTAGINSAS